MIVLNVRVTDEKPRKRASTAKVNRRLAQSRADYCVPNPRTSAPSAVTMPLSVGLDEQKPHANRVDPWLPPSMNCDPRVASHPHLLAPSCQELLPPLRLCVISSLHPCLIRVHPWLKLLTSSPPHLLTILLRYPTYVYVYSTRSETRRPSRSKTQYVTWPTG